jgi:hypothetical protein
LLPAISAVAASEEVREIMVDVEIGPSDIVATEDFDVGELGLGGVFQALEKFTLDNEAGAIVDLENDEVEGRHVFGRERGWLWRQVPGVFESGVDVGIGDSYFPLSHDLASSHSLKIASA